MSTIPGERLVNSGEVEQSVGLEGNAGAVKSAPLTETQKAGMRLAIGVGSLATVCTLIVVVGYFATAPAALTSADLLGSAKTLAENADAAKKVIENYKALRELHSEQTAKLFDTVVVKMLLPIFTLLLGYIFGNQKAAKG